MNGKPLFSPITTRRFGFLTGALLCAATWQSVQADEAPPEKPVETSKVTAGAEKAALTADAVQEAFVRVAEQIKPSVVTIYVERARRGSATAKNNKDAPKPELKPEPKLPDPDDEDEPFFPFGPQDPRERRTSLGTGMVVSNDGYILTNHHVIKDATFVRVYFNADSERPDRAAARVISADPESDLALLKVDRENLTPVQWADSDKVRIGEWSIAIGSPFDQAQSVTVGIVSAKGRHLEGSGKPSIPDYIQTDASINPGNSGGPLINLDGKVIGINTAILSPSRFNVGIGFSLPSNTIKELLPVLLEGKVIKRGFLGIQYVPLESEVAREFGVGGGMQIGAMGKDSPAGKAGLQVDDIITAINGKNVLGSGEFRRTVIRQAPGDKLTLTVMRPSETTPQPKDYIVTLGDWAAGTGTKLELPTLDKLPEGTKLGLEVENADKLAANERELFGLNQKSKGLYIVDVLPGSPADDSQVSRGLRLLRARVSGEAWQDVPNKAAFERIEKTLAPGARVLIQFKDRDDVSVYKVLILPKSAGTTGKADNAAAS
jgi:serine protease Do